MSNDTTNRIPTPAEVAEYLPDGGNHCIYCKSAEIVGGPIKAPQAGYIMQPVDCRDCGATWRDQYQLTAVLIDTEGEPGFIEIKPETADAGNLAGMLKQLARGAGIDVSLWKQERPHFNGAGLHRYQATAGDAISGLPDDLKRIPICEYCYRPITYQD